MYLLYVSRKTK